MGELTMIEPLYFVLAKLYAKKHGQCKIGEPTYTASGYSFGTIQRSIYVFYGIYNADDVLMSKNITVDKKSIVFITYSLVSYSENAGKNLLRDNESIYTRKECVSIGSGWYLVHVSAIDILEPGTYTYKILASDNAEMAKAVLEIAIVPLE